MARAPRFPRAWSRNRWLTGLAAACALLVVAGGAVVLRMLPGLTTDVPGNVPRLVYAEFGATSDQLYTTPATDPTKRTLVDTVQHAQGWGLNPGTMSGSLVVYTVLPEGADGRGAPAELWLIDVKSKDKTRLARDADLLVKPQFVDPKTVIYRRSNGDLQSVVRVDVPAQSRDVVYEERTAFGITPVGFDATGALVFTRLSAGGTDVLSVRPGSPPTLLFHASDEIARDWQLSPDGRAIAFLAPEARGERVVYRAQVVSLSGAHPAILPEFSANGEQYGPTWTPDGHLTVGNEAGTAGAAPITLLRPGGSPITMAAPAHGFDVPFAWSQRGEFLAARTFDGTNSTNPGRESAVVIGVDGARRGIPAAGEVILVGWLTNA